MHNEVRHAWLQQLLGERVSAEITLEISEHPRRAYHLRHGSRLIEMPVWYWGLGEAVANCAAYDAQREGWKSVLGGPMPAPGTTQLLQPLVETTAYGCIVHYDVLGLVWWMLSRAEEFGRGDLDEHGRFPATSSHAYRHGYLGRPVVDEWLYLLRQVVQRVWPGMRLTEIGFRMRVSHDVDRPSEYAFCGPRQLLRGIAVDLIRKRDLRSAVRRPWAWVWDRELHAADPCNTFQWLMDLSESRGLKSAFYFVCGRTEPRFDPRYEVESSAIRALIRSIHRRGHEIGLHPSYGTYLDAAAIQRETDALRKVCAQEGVSQDSWGGRMHYLRWSAPVTLWAWEDAGLAYDATLGYADQIGFRCGTCFDYTALDPTAQRAPRLRIRPLIAMDATVLSKSYMALRGSAARDEMVKLKDRCRAVGGSFTLLWHNSSLTTCEERRLYEDMLDA